ncbi:MAG: hypothetical protein ACRBN8_11315 [Nannocystales bacterium]
MDELNPNARALLDAARGASSPTSQEVAALRDRLGFAAPPPPSQSAPEPSAPQTSILRRIVVGGVAAAALGAAGLAATASRPAPSRLDPIATYVPEQRAPAPHIETPQPRQDVTAHESSAPNEDPPSVQRPRKRRGSTKNAATSAAAQPKGSDLQAELALIVKARRALTAGNNSSAKTTAQTYAREFPTGAFVEEAEVLKLIASCNLRSTPATTKRAQAYVERGASSFAQRVRKSCLEPRD